MVAVDFLPRIGGVSVMVHHLANALAQLGHDVAVLAPRGAAIPEDFEAQYRLLHDAAARTSLREGPGALEEDQRIAALLGTIRREFPFTRVLLMHAFYYGPGAVAFARRHAVPVSVFFYGFELRSVLLPARTWRERVRRILFGRYTLRGRTRTVIRDADELLPISNYTAALLRSTGTRRPIRVSGCGIAEADRAREFRLTAGFDRAEKRRRREALGLPLVPTLLFVGRLVASKNVSLLIEALALLADVRGIILGTGPERESLHQLARSVGILERLRWIEHASETEKWTLLRASDALCLPSRELSAGQVEGFGIVLLEAAAAGTPVIAARSGGMVDVVSHGETGMLCDPLRPEDLAKQSTQLLGDDLLSASCVANSRRQIEQKFNWPTIASNIAGRGRA
jgi:glycosyltransferase involved in cell wall biosynthesis